MIWASGKCLFQSSYGYWIEFFDSYFLNRCPKKLCLAVKHKNASMKVCTCNWTGLDHRSPSLECLNGIALTCIFGLHSKPRSSDSLLHGGASSRGHEQEAVNQSPMIDYICCHTCISRLFVTRGLFSGSYQNVWIMHNPEQMVMVVGLFNRFTAKILQSIPSISSIVSRKTV